MVSARPPPSPAKGRIPYPSASNYVPGDADNSPTYLGSAEPIRKTASRDSENERRAQGMKQWWKGLKEGERSEASGSSKRMKELQTIFDTPPKYGKDINWKSLPYTTHDVATIFRRRTLASHNEGDTSENEAVAEFKSLIQALPRIHLHLLLYVLDLLSVFARHSDQNLMNVPNLALIFQPGMINHPLHAMHPKEHVLSQQVVEFLINHQDNFVLGMELTHRRKEKASSPPPPPPRVKADPDMMLPSDSDDDVPEGGYYVIETNRRPISPAAVSPQSASLTLPSIDASLLPAPPMRTRVHPDLMEMSESDDEAPPGGYEIRDNPRAAMLIRARDQAAGIGSPTGLATSPESKKTIGSSVTRRRTMPTKRLGSSTAKPRRNSFKEAP
ncbi:hypothetical protein IAU60_004581 [Kwoniella sp. DSM 27419]